MSPLSNMLSMFVIAFLPRMFISCPQNNCRWENVLEASSPPQHHSGPQAERGPAIFNMWLHVTMTRKPDGGGYTKELEWVVFMDQTQELRISFQLISHWLELSHRSTYNGKGFGRVVELCQREDGCAEHTCSLWPCLA